MKILAANYGEAGAIKILGKKYNLPDPVCPSGSFWLFGPGTTTGNVAISIGIEKEMLANIYADSQLVQRLKNPYAMEENNVGIYINRQPLISLKTIWPTLEKQVFN